MRVLFFILVGLLGLVAIPSPEAQGRRAEKPLLPKPEIVNVDFHVRLAAAFMSGLPEADQCNARFLSLTNLPKVISPVFFRRVLTWWLHQLSFRPAVAYPVVVPGSDGLLLAIDITSYGWNAGAFSKVANRETVFREPAINNKDTEYLRRIIGVKQNPNTFHAEAIIDAFWLFRETIETDRSNSYYDLLFARQRFIPAKVGDKIRVEKEVTRKVTKKEKVTYAMHDPNTGKRWYEDFEEDVTREVKELVSEERAVEVDGFRETNFPANKKDWDSISGGKVVRDFLKAQEIRVLNGAVVAGSTEDPKNGSFVARSNRLLEFEPGPFGVIMQSFDVANATGKKDYLEQAPELAKGNIEFDAQELLFGLPNGGQASMLTNGLGIRVEVADAKVAKDADTRDVRVRNPGSCVVCHSLSDGVIPPRSLIKEYLDAGVDLKFKKRKEYEDFLAYYLDWERKMKGWQDPYASLRERTTRLDPEDRKSKFLTAAELSAGFKKCRDVYDEPVSTELAAQILGVPVAVLKGLAIQLPKGRANGLVRGIPCPRPAFDADVLPLLQKILAADKLGAK